jgi:hypothetical protein
MSSNILLVMPTRILRHFFTAHSGEVYHARKFSHKNNKVRREPGWDNQKE